MQTTIAGKTKAQWRQSHPLLDQLIRNEETFWFNRRSSSVNDVIPTIDIGPEDVLEAEARLDRFAAYIAKVFPETRKSNGMIESSLQAIPAMQKAMERQYGLRLKGRLMLKCDFNLPISGSIKARGGIYEVLKHAETLALDNGLLSLKDNYACLAAERFTRFFNQYAIAVGSTGNLGLSIGIISACLGFKVTVHMSADARQWKKDLLRSKGVKVIEYADDYSKAVEQGRQQANGDASCHFIDDENSKDLFMGYAVAAQRLKYQLDRLQIIVDEHHPLFVYLPCGVGGGPGGVTFGLKLAFGDGVYCFFAEPTHSPAMFVGLYTDKHDQVCVQDFGIDNITDADGLAVGRPSGFVGQRLKSLIDGVFTISDNAMYRHLALLSDHENIFMEPSALAGLPGIVRILDQPEYLAFKGLDDKMESAVHIAWGTGGSMVPSKEMQAYYRKGKALLNQTQIV
jgi:D-serine dehydratase